jgi:hypothetical protein
MSEPNKKSSVAKIIAQVIALIFLGFIIAIVIPNFIRFRQVSVANACVNYLREIDVAKNEWALKTGKKDGDICTEDDIRPYTRLDSKGNFPRCPDGGVYTLGKIGENPTCSFGKTNSLHVLP